MKLDHLREIRTTSLTSPICRLPWRETGNFLWSWISLSPVPRLEGFWSPVPFSADLYLFIYPGL